MQSQGRGKSQLFNNSLKHQKNCHHSFLDQTLTYSDVSFILFDQQSKTKSEKRQIVTLEKL